MRKFKGELGRAGDYTESDVSNRHAKNIMKTILVKTMCSGTESQAPELTLILLPRF